MDESRGPVYSSESLPQGRAPLLPTLSILERFGCTGTHTLFLRLEELEVPGEVPLAGEIFEGATVGRVVPGQGPMSESPTLKGPRS